MLWVLMKACGDLWMLAVSNEKLDSTLKIYSSWWKLWVFDERLRSPKWKIGGLRWNAWVLHLKNLVFLIKSLGPPMKSFGVYCLHWKSIVSDKKLGVFYERLQSPMNYWGSPIKKLEALYFVLWWKAWCLR